VGIVEDRCGAKRAPEVIPCLPSGALTFPELSLLPCGVLGWWRVLHSLCPALLRGFADSIGQPRVRPQTTATRSCTRARAVLQRDAFGIGVYTRTAGVNFEPRVGPVVWTIFQSHAATGHCCTLLYPMEFVQKLLVADDR
jgi:hypothetical protein